MDFLGVGIPEIIAIIILALIFIGPRDLPKVAGRFAKFLRDLRMMTEGFRTEWQREMNAATRVEGLKELREELIATRNSLREAGQDVREAMTIDLEELDEEAEAEAAKKKPSAKAAANPEAKETAKAASKSKPAKAEAKTTANKTAAKTTSSTPTTANKTKAESKPADTKAAEDARSTESTDGSNEEAEVDQKPKPEAKDKTPTPKKTPANKAAATKSALPEPEPDLPEMIQIDLDDFPTNNIQPPETTPSTVTEETASRE